MVTKQYQTNKKNKQASAYKSQTLYFNTPQDLRRDGWALFFIRWYESRREMQRAYLLPEIITFKLRVL